MKYLPKLSTALLFFLFIIANYLLFAGRKSEALKSEWILTRLPDFYLHVSNFSISCFLYTAIGYVWILVGVRFRNIILFGICLIGANFIYELLIPVLNTPDIIDAYYGYIGTALGFFLLVLIKKYGIKPNTIVAEKK